VHGLVITNKVVKLHNGTLERVLRRLESLRVTWVYTWLRWGREYLVRDPKLIEYDKLLCELNDLAIKGECSPCSTLGNFRSTRRPEGTILLLQVSVLGA
jgi:hypothetical protein